MNFEYLNPEKIEEWERLFIETVEIFQGVDIPNPLELREGEIVDSVDILNVEYSKAGKVMKELLIPKQRANRLKDIAVRWKNQIIRNGIKASSRDREKYPNQEVQKAYAEGLAEEYYELIDKAQSLIDAIHDQRSRLWMYRKDLTEMGHNARLERKEERK